MSVKERPVLFKAEMVRAILDGRKTQTRRIVKAKDSEPERCITLKTLMRNIQEWRQQEGRWFGIDGWDTLVFADCPYGQVGDHLWVKETWTPDHADFYPHFPLCYRADFGPEYERENGKVWSSEQNAWFPFKWRPSIFMPRWASRITLEITSVRVERLREISEQDAASEGVKWRTGNPGECRTCARGAFMDLWESINGKDSWAANPWVWCIEFKRLR